MRQRCYRYKKSWKRKQESKQHEDIKQKDVMIETLENKLNKFEEQSKAKSIEKMKLKDNLKKITKRKAQQLDEKKEKVNDTHD